MKVKPAASDASRRQGKEAVPQRLMALAQTRLRASPVRITDARVKVLAALLGARRALSHQDVQDKLADMDRVTLYRALDCLTEAGLAHKIAGDDRIFRYSAGADSAASPAEGDGTAQHQHGHFKCTRCARVFCLDSVAEAEALQVLLKEGLGKGFRGHDIEFTIKGWCADCAH